MHEPNLDVAAAFLDALSDEGPAAAHTFQVYGEGPNDPDDPKNPLHGTIAELGSRLTELNNDGYGVSVCVARTDFEGRTYENVLRPRAVFLDFDEGDPPATVWDFADALVRTVRGWHAYFFLRHTDPGRPDWSMWETVQRVAARRFGAEEIVDHTKAMRLPGFYHLKREPTLVELQRCEHHRRLLPEVADQLGLVQAIIEERKNPTPTRSSRSSGPRRSRPSRYDPARVSTPERVEQYRDWVAKQPSAVEGSGGHDQLMHVIKMAWNYGVDWDSAWSVVEDYNMRCDPPWNPRSLRSQFQSAGPTAESRGRFDPSSWERAIWVPEPPVVKREGANPPDEPPLPDEPPPPRRRGGRRKRDSGGPPPREDPPWPDDDDHPTRPGLIVLDPERPRVGAGKFLEHEHTDDGVRTLHRQHKVYWRWKGCHYREASDEAVEAELYAFIGRAKRKVITDNGPRFEAYGERRPRLTDMEKALRSLTLVDDQLETPCWLDAKAEDPNPAELLVCRNGVVHLPSGKFMPPNPRLFVTNSLGVPYTPTSKTPERWLAFLEELWPDDRESCALLQEWFGYCLTADMSHHKAMIIVGPPRAGKGTIANVLQALLSPASVTSMMMGDFVSEFGLWRLIGKTLAIIPDARVSGRSDSAAIVEKFLAITGGDLISVNRKSLKPVDLHLKSRFLLLTNVVPQLADAAAAFPQRLIALSLERSFVGEENRQLLPELLTELPAILNWAIAGWHRLRANGRFTVAKTAQHVVESLEEASSPVRAFVRQCCDLDQAEWSATSELFEAWKKWCAYHGRQPGSSSTFGRNLRAAVPEVTASRPRSGDRTRGFSGIRVDHERIPQEDRRPYQRGPQEGFEYGPGEH